MPPRTPTRLALGGLPGRDTPTVLPAGSTESVVAGGLDAPTALEVAPDGRLLVAGQTGKLFAVAGGAEDAAPALDPPARLGTAVERGLLGVTLGPDSAANGCVYGVAPPGDSCSVGPGVYGVYCCRWATPLSPEPRVATWLRPALSPGERAAALADRGTHPDPVVRRKTLALWAVHMTHPRQQAAGLARVGIAPPSGTSSPTGAAGG